MWIANNADFDKTPEWCLLEAMTDINALQIWRLMSPNSKIEDIDYDEAFALKVVKEQMCYEEPTPSWPEVDGPKSGQKGETMMDNMMANMGADKFMERMFRRAEGVVWDLMSGKVGIKTDGGIATLNGKGDAAEVEINMFDQFGMAMPAFAQNTPIEAVAIGDVIYFGSKDKPGWVIEKRYGVKPVGSSTPVKRTAKAAAAETVSEDSIDKSNVQFTLMKVDGQRTTWKPPKVTLLGMGDNGVMVLRSLLNMLPGGQAGLAGMQNMMMPLMMMGGMGGEGDDGDSNGMIEKMLPMLLMGQMQAPVVQNPDGTQVVQQNPMAQMMPMMMMMSMMKKGGGGLGDMFGGNGPKKPNGGGHFRG